CTSFSYVLLRLTQKTPTTFYSAPIMMQKDIEAILFDVGGTLRTSVPTASRDKIEPDPQHSAADRVRTWNLLPSIAS
ncbi:MAG: hypothetical protein M0C28_43790, partial [Candidatus Moduliflexus flocculans]|nr:hypothetical protein [Candidatus Moduliflexus flocculans]